MATLTLAYRPHGWNQVVGQKHILPILAAMVRSGEMPPAMIFGGSRGTGKTTCARILAAALNCEVSKTGDSCGECSSCKGVQATNNMSVIEIDAASNGGVENVRSIRDKCMYAHSGEWRVVLLDEAHSMSKEAFNALLKIMEEPPEQTVFVLVTTEVDKILETIRSRAMEFEFRRISQAEIEERLTKIAKAEGFEITAGLVEVIAARVQGGMRNAIMLLDQMRMSEITDEDGFKELFGVEDVSPELFRAALNGDQAAGSKIIGEQYRRTGDALGMTNDLTLLVRDLLVLKADGVPECTSTNLKTRQALAELVDERQLVRVVHVLWELRARVRSFETDQRAAMEMAFVLVAEAMRARQAAGKLSAVAPQGQAVPAAEPKLGISQIRIMLGEKAAG